MAPINEIDAMKIIDEALSSISEPDARDRILKWACSKFSPAKLVVQKDGDIMKEVTGRSQRKKGKKPNKVKSSPTLVKDLNLKPSGKKSFEDFVKDKSPSSNREKCVVSVYYIINELKQGPVTTNHVYTCFKIMNWRVPADLENTLQWVASQKGWLDTANMSDIKLSTHGENLIEHDLPRKEIK